MSLINDALKRANQFPQPPLILENTSAFRPVEIAKPPSLPLTLLVLLLILLGPLAWLTYRNSQRNATSGAASPLVKAQARDISRPFVPPSAPVTREMSLARNSDSARTSAQLLPSSAYPTPTPALGPRRLVPPQESPPNSISSRTHTIKPGETPTSIARLYGIKLQTLLEANPSVNARRLKIGQALSIPSC